MSVTTTIFSVHVFNAGFFSEKSHPDPPPSHPTRLRLTTARRVGAEREQQSAEYLIGRVTCSHRILYASTLSRRAFTLVELLVVIAIIAILAAILLPVLNQAQSRAKRIQCLNNQQQMAMAAQIYTADNSTFYPVAYYFDSVKNISYCWDFTTYESSSHVVPGVLWQGQTNPQIQQCPSFTGNANWYGDPFTGYNYNTSYIGHGQGEAIEQPAKDSALRHPAKTVIFGDGQFSGGADKFMRAPWPDRSNSGDSSDVDDLRSSGTQGFRHSGLSNVAFCDGHAESLSACCTNYESSPYNPSIIATGTGFLSMSNALYSLK